MWRAYRMWHENWSRMVDILGCFGARGGSVEALRYKPEGRGFDSRWFHWNFWHNHSGRAMALGSTQTVTEVNTRNISWWGRRPVRRADNLTTFMCRLSWKSGNLNLLEPSGPVQACTGIALPIINPFQPRDAIWHHSFHLFLKCMPFAHWLQ